MGLTVIRFNDADVKVDMNNVLMAIEGWIERNNPLPPGNTTPCPPFLRGNYPLILRKSLFGSFITYHYQIVTFQGSA
jgi:hypothetical protein